MSNMRTIIPGDIPVRDFHQFLLGSVAPRPIAFVSTINEDGVANLAPYSFFNAFSSNPPILVFSSNRKVADNTTKDTLKNVQTSKECVINVVNYQIVRQMAVSSVEFSSNVSEFDKTGLTPIPSDIVRPFRVKESPVQMECKVKDIITLGDQGGAGHLIICDVVRFHIAEEVINENGRIDPHKMDLMGRMGRSFYVRASGPNVFPIYQSLSEQALGYSAIPESARKSAVLSANQIGMLASLENWPSLEEAKKLLLGKGVIEEALASDHPTASLHQLVPEGFDQNEKEYAAALIVLADQHAYLS